MKRAIFSVGILIVSLLAIYSVGCSSDDTDGGGGGERRGDARIIQEFMQAWIKYGQTSALHALDARAEEPTHKTVQSAHIQSFDGRVIQEAEGTLTLRATGTPCAFIRFKVTPLLIISHEKENAKDVGEDGKEEEGGKGGMSMPVVLHIFLAKDTRQIIAITEEIEKL